MGREPQDGGPAFPVTRMVWTKNHPDGETITFPGMTLREWYAGMALKGLLASWGVNPTERDGRTEEQIAEQAVRLADAMLRTRTAP